MSSAASLLRPSLSLNATQRSMSVDVGPLSSMPDSGDACEASMSPCGFMAQHSSPAALEGLSLMAKAFGKADKKAPQIAFDGIAPGDPFDRGTAAAAAAAEEAALAAKLAGSWQLGVTRNAAAAAVLAECGAERIACGGIEGIKAEAARYIATHELDDTFYIVDLANVLRMFKAWRAALPRVAPFYAVKCYPEPAMLRLLAALGAGFDCASKGEVEAVLRLGVAPSRIIFAHPCKRACDLRYARTYGISLSTFDTISELHKIAAIYPEMRCVLRIRADDPQARVPLGLKYGADPGEAPALLEAAAKLGLEVVGVSFHVGSACQNLAAFTAAIASAADIFAAGAAAGHTNMTLLDIGGGFSGRFDACGNVVFGDIASAINAALVVHFPPERGVRVIAEPGRFFAEAAASLIVPVYGVRDRTCAKTGAAKKDYWITDGLYGSFNCILYDGQNPAYRILRSPLLPPPPPECGTAYPSTIWGPTCDSADVVYKDVPLPLLRNGDWLAFPNAGAYTVAGACDFNGIEFTAPNKFYVFSDSAVDRCDADDCAHTDTNYGIAAADAAATGATAAARDADHGPDTSLARITPGIV